MSDREPIDSLQIDIESSSTDASKSLDALVSSLKKLDRIGKSNSFLLVKKRLQGIASVRFDDLDKQLRSITKNVKSLETVQKALKNLKITTPKIDTASVSNSVNKITGELERVAQPVIASGEVFGGNKEPEKPVWLKDLQSECSEIVKSFDDSVSKIAEARNRLNAALMEKQESYSSETAFINGSNFADTLSDKLSKLELQSTILQDKMNDLANSDSPDPTQWNTLEKQLLTVKLQYQAIEQQIIKNADAVELLGDKSKKTKGLLEKLWDKFKNVAFYRIVRTLLAQLTRGITAGLGNIAKFSEEANNILSSYKTEFTYIQNSLGAALLPILQSILPVVTRISDGLVDITNSIGMVSAALNGQSSFLKAKKYAQDYADTVEEVKKSTVGFDELNILGNNNQSQNDASQMFEKVDISGWDVAGAVAKITAITTSLTALLMLIKGVKLGDVFTKMGKGIGTAYKYLKNATTWKKAGISIAALAAEAAVCYTSFYDLGSGTKSLGSTLLTVIPVCAAVGVAMTAMLGPVGWVITALVGVVSAIAGIAKGASDLKHQNDMAAFFQTTGVEISKVSSMLDEYFDSLNINRQAEYNAQLDRTRAELKECARNYDSLWESIAKNETLSSENVNDLTTAFNSLADAAITLNKASINSIMENIRTGIEINITPELTAKLEGLVDSLGAAQDLINAKITGLKAEYNQLLNEILKNGGSISDEQRTKLNDLRTQINTFTLNGDYSSQTWARNLEEALAKGVNAGTNEQEIKDSISSLLEQRDTYIGTIQDSYDKSVATLKQLIKIDQEQFGGALGFKESDLDVLKENYNAQLATVYKQYNDVLQSIWDSYKLKALDYDKYVTDYGGDGFEGWLDTVGAGIGGLFGWAGLRDTNGDTGWEHNANKKTAKAQKEFLDWLASLIESAPAHANGGFPEDGLFFANHSELVGKFSNGRTAVANNEQIVEGIKRGVAEAMSETSNSNCGSWVIQIVDTDGNVKGEKIITAAERKNRRDGKTVIAIGG